MELLNKIQKELNVGKTLHNKFGNYYYRSAEQILEAVKPLLGKGILTLSDEIIMLSCDGTVEHKFFDKQGAQTAQENLPATRFYVKATATLKDGGESVSVSAFARETETKKGMDDAQVTGSASSYARKYALNGLFCLCDTQDPDDMDNTKNGAGQSHTPPPKTASPPPPSDVKQEAQQAQQELGNHFDQSAQQQAPPPAATPPAKTPPPAQRPAPTKEQRAVLNMLYEYYKTQVKSPNIKVDPQKMLDLIWLNLSRYPSMSDIDLVKQYVKIEEVVNVVA